MSRARCALRRWPRARPRRAAARPARREDAAHSAATGRDRPSRLRTYGRRARCEEGVRAWRASTRPAPRTQWALRFEPSGPAGDSRRDSARPMARGSSGRGETSRCSRARLLEAGDCRRCRRHAPSGPERRDAPRSLRLRPRPGRRRRAQVLPRCGGAKSLRNCIAAAVPPVSEPMDLRPR